jgi:hypothetical protein
MSSTVPSSALIEGLQEYLNQGPQGDYQQLKEIAASLKDAESNDALAMAQVLGTAVGKQREKHLVERHDLANTI